MVGSSAPFHSASLYVGDLVPDASEGLLFEIFNTVGPVASIRVCRDAVTKRSLGYAYVNFHHVNDAERALDTMNYTLIKGKPCRIMWSQRDPTLRKSGVGNVFVKNLDPSIDHKALYEIFSLFGNILSCKIATDEQGRSQGYGYVHYESEEAATEAIAKINKMQISDKEVYVGQFVRRNDRTGQSDWTNLYVKNFPAHWTDEKLSHIFTPYGAITSCKVQQTTSTKNNIDPKKKSAFIKAAKDREEERIKAEKAKEIALDEDDENAVTAAEEILSRIAGEEAEAEVEEAKIQGTAFGWVNFEDHESATAAIDALNGTTTLTVHFIDEKTLPTEKETENVPPTDESAINKENNTVSTNESLPKNELKLIDEPRTIDLHIPLFVGRAQKKADRERELKQKFEQAKMERIKKYQGVNLFIKNLDDSLSEDDLREHFNPFGTITSIRIMRDSNNQTSRGFGFVCFSNQEEANKAVQEMNNLLIRGKPIFVAIAQRKEVRRAQLEAQHAQRRTPYGMGGAAGGPAGGPGGPMPHMGAPHMAGPYGAVPVMYQPGAQHPMMPPAMTAPHVAGPGQVRGGYVIARASPRGGMPIANGQDIRGFGALPRGAYGMAPHAMTPQQLAAMGAPAGMVPAGPHGHPQPGQPQGQQGGSGNRRNRSRGGQQSTAGGNQQGGPQQYKYTQNARNAGGPLGQNPNQHGTGHPMTQQHAQMMVHGGQMPPAAGQQMQMNQQQQQQQQQRAVAHAQEPLTLSALASASPQVQKNMIGERLYPLIHQSQPELAGKITGMLLEMDNSELLHLLESPDALRMKVSEALEVLKQHQAQLQQAQGVQPE